MVVFVHGHLFLLAGIHLHGQSPAFMGGRIHLWVVGALVQCGAGLLVVSGGGFSWPFA